jgi:hypothetical protein
LSCREQDLRDRTIAKHDHNGHAPELRKRLSQYRPYPRPQQLCSRAMVMFFVDRSLRMKTKHRACPLRTRGRPIRRKFTRMRRTFRPSLRQRRVGRITLKPMISAVVGPIVRKGRRTLRHWPCGRRHVCSQLTSPQPSQIARLNNPSYGTCVSNTTQNQEKQVRKPALS